MNSKGRFSKGSSTNSLHCVKCGSVQSFILGFLSAALLGYLLLYNHFIQIAVNTNEGAYMTKSSLKSSHQTKESMEIQQLLKSVDQLYEKVAKQSLSPNMEVAADRAMRDVTNQAKPLTQSPSLPSSTGEGDTILSLKSEIESMEFYKGLNLDPLRRHLSASNSKNIVFALAANIDPKYFAIFVKSFRRYSKDSTMFVFVNLPVDRKVQELAETNNIMLIGYDVDKLEPSFLRKYHPSSLRWILYDRILRLPLQSESTAEKQQFFGSVVEKIIALDARDSAFQRDPFALFSGTDDRLLVFGEDRHSAIGQCGWNSAWVKDCFPRTVYDQVATNPIICSGISMGAASAMSRYVKRMADIISGEEKELVNAAEHFPHCERNGVDQGVHNVLVHAFQRDLNIRILYPEDFPVVNMQSGKEMTIISSDESGRKRVFMTRQEENNPSQKESFAVVHQFDRDNDLQASLAKEYIDWINWGDLKSEWGATSACASMSYVDQADLFKAMCDIGAARAISAATCCEACARKTIESGKKCTGFTYYGGVCYLKNCDKEIIRRQKTVWEQGGTPKMRLAGALSGFVNPNALFQR